MSLGTLIKIQRADGTTDVMHKDDPCPAVYDGAILSVHEDGFSDLRLYIVEHVSYSKVLDMLVVRELSVFDSLKIRVRWFVRRAKMLCVCRKGRIHLGV